MEGDTEVPNLSFCFQFQCRFIGVTFLKISKVVCSLCVHQIKVKILNTTGFQLALKQRTNVLLFFEKEVGEFIREDIAVTGITAGQTCFQSSLTLAAQITVSRIKVVEAIFQKSIHHTAGLLGIHLSVIHRQTHTTKAKILFDSFHNVFLPVVSIC